ncbi:MAG TPA: MFS transporter [Burkholderiales bacterium]|jgi:MFS family permease|nr:MFS transporter [Burkholderiales bacterium]
MSSPARTTRRNVGLLAACQAMLLSNNSTLIAINGLAGLALAPTPALATLPVTCWVAGGALSTMPASHYMKRVGRRSGLMHGMLFAVAGALLCSSAMWLGSFWTLCLGALVFGVYNAFGQYYRFVAADASPPEWRSTAISLVLAGGLVGGLLGPAVSRQTVQLPGPRFAGAYLELILYAAAMIALVALLRLPEAGSQDSARRGRPLAEIARQPKFIVAVLSGAIGYGVMNFLMTSTPIAMQACGHPFGDAAFVISSHVIAMFAPSFFTGPLIKRVGVLPVLFAGAALNLVTVAVAISGVAVANFWWALVLLGVGWNFLYIGGTALLTETYRPEERATAQGANETAVFVMMVVSSLASGMIVTGSGWEKVNLAALPLIVIAIAAITWFGYLQRSARA